MTINTRAAEGFNIAQEIQRLWSEIRALHTAQRLPASTISTGALVVESLEGIEVREGGGLRLLDGGEFASYYASGNSFLNFGRFTYGGGEFTEHGLMIRKDAVDDDQIFEVMQGWDGLTHIYSGRPASPLNQFEVWSQNIVLDAANYGGWTYITHDTTSNPASCYIAANGAIQRTTSALKYKQDIEDGNPDQLADAALALRPRTWRDRNEVTKDPTATRRYLGFIAEEVTDAGLDILVTRNEDTDEPEGLAYGQITAPLVALAQRQQTEITELREQLAALTARVDALTATTEEAP